MNLPIQKKKKEAQSRSMEHFGDFIDYDEGRDIDPREAFYTHALPCESCGKPCDERHTATWDLDLQVGPCCAVDLSGIPEVPVCAELARVLMRCATVGQVSDAYQSHKQVCRVCNPEAPQMQLPEAA